MDTPGGLSQTEQTIVTDANVHQAYGSVSGTLKDVRPGTELSPLESSIYFQDYPSREIVFNFGRNITLRYAQVTGFMNGYFYDSAGNLMESAPIQAETILWANRFSGAPQIGIPLPIQRDIPLEDVRDLSVSIRYTNPDFPISPTRNYELAYTAYVSWTE